MTIKKIIIFMVCLLLFLSFFMIGCDSRTKSSSRDDLFVIFPYDRYGFMDREGNVVIPTRFDFAGDCGEGLMPVKEKGKWGVINAEGDYIIRVKNLKMSAEIQELQLPIFSSRKSLSIPKNCRPNTMIQQLCSSSKLISTAG